MPAVVVSIDAGSTGAAGKPRSGVWSLLSIARPESQPAPFGILFAGDADDRLVFRLREPAFFEDLSEQEQDILAALGDDLALKGRESGGSRVIADLEDTASHFFRVTDRAVIACSGSAEATVDRLFAEHVLGRPEESPVLPFVTHLPLYGLRAAATKFGELMESSQEGWVRAPERLRLTEGMFVARVVGRSMEPRIPDGSFCVFRGPVTGSRQGRLVLIEKLDETDFAWRYTVKRYARREVPQGSGLTEEDGGDEARERTEKIRLEPLNREFEAFELEADQFRVIAEFVQVLPS